MIEAYNYSDMHINERSSFTDKVLDFANQYADNDAEFKALLQVLNEKNQIFCKSIEKQNLVYITNLLAMDDEQRDSGFANLKKCALSFSSRLNMNWAVAGHLVLNSIKALEWSTNYLGKDEVTRLIDSLLAQIDSKPALKQAISTIKASGWVKEIRRGQAKYKQHDALRTAALKACDKTASIEASRDVGVALDRLFLYINFQIEYKANDSYAALASNINKIAASYRATQKLRASLVENANKELGSTKDIVEDKPIPATDM